MKKLHELLKYYRLKAGLTPKAVARQLKISYSYYMRLEKPFDEGKAVPSEDLLRKFVSVVISDPDEREKACKELLRARTALIIPPELFQEAVSSGSETEYSEGMPKEFIERAKSDIEYVGMSKVVKALGVSQRVIEEFLQGKRVLSRDSVIKLANIVEQPVSEYLALAGYIPDNLRDLLKTKENTEAFFRVVEKIPPDEIGEFINRLSELINFFSKMKT